MLFVHECFLVMMMYLRSKTMSKIWFTFQKWQLNVSILQLLLSFYQNVQLNPL